MHSPEQMSADEVSPSFFKSNGIEINVDEQGVESISAETLSEILNHDIPGVRIVDVRDKDEYDAGHISNVQNYPMSLAQYKTLKQTAEEVEDEKMVVFICQTGPRSDNASSVMADFLAEEGSKCRAVSVAGGMNALDSIKATQAAEETGSTEVAH